MEKKKSSHKLLIIIFILSFVVSSILFALRLKHDFKGADGAVSVMKSQFPLSFKGKGNIGVVTVEGIIMESLPILEELKEFEEDSDIKAIIVRVDSPGGAVGPSQEIFDELKRLRDSKKIIVSLGAVAASGGYYVAAAGHKIISAPGTMTGSIGVIMQMSYLEKFYDWIRIQPFVIKSGKFKDVGNPGRKMLPEERELLQKLIDNTHLQFQKAVAWGRGLPLDYVKTFADGRIMNGEIAMGYGLVDALGNFSDAVRIAGEMAGVDKPRLVYPRQHKWDQLKELFESSLSIGKKALQKLNILPLETRPAFLWDMGS